MVANALIRDAIDAGDAEAQRKGNLQAIRSLAPFARPYRTRIIFAFVTLLVAAASTLAMPVAIRYLIDAGFSSSGVGSVDQHFLILFGLAITMAVFSAMRFYLVSWIGERIVADLRSAVFKHVLKMTPTFFEVTRTGEVLSRLTADTTLIQTVVGSSLSIALRSFVILIGGLIMLTITSVKLTAMIVLLVPIIVFPIVLVGRKIRNLSRDTQDRIADTSALAAEVLNAIQVVQAFTLEKLHGGRYDDAIEHSFETALRRIKTRALMTVYAILIIFCGIVTVLWVGAQNVVSGHITGGELGQFLFYAIIVGSSTAGLTEIWGSLLQAAGATERLTELLHTEPRITRPVHPISLPIPSPGTVTFCNVTFNYPSRPTQSALRDFSLDVRSGETIALVGPSGAGKSTVFQLILDFYQPTTGMVRVDGVDIRNADPFDVRNRVGMVPQDTVLFADNVLENIRYGKSEATDSEVIAAAVSAGADEFITRLPDGYSTFVGERGIRLSGGQKQRIAIARAILRRPSILLLDEATSALDAASEKLVQDALENLMTNCTTIIIAHRLSTILNSDRIIVMDRGRIITTGRHAELLAKGGLYTKLAALQFREEQRIELPA
ncbi:MAG: ABC transporter transmembrane domain-containing protein [Proteobacteria bacterium]|nr:ABC transporter transmembrane domain-containing protein [Pseudomonadota bacterium]